MKSPEDFNEVEKLESLIAQHSIMYYQGLDELNGLTPISDHDFDILMEKLSVLNPTSKFLDPVMQGYELVAGKPTTPQSLYPINGISKKTKSTNIINYLINNGIVYDSYSLTPKLDGGSVILTYLNHALVNGLTRGKTHGSNVTDIIHQLPSVPKRINSSELTVIRGELVCISEVAKNARNLANGMLMRRNYTLTNQEKLDFVFVPYTILSHDYHKQGELLTIRQLSSEFIHIPFQELSYDQLKEVFNSPEELNSLIYHLSDDNKYLIDGIIIEPRSILKTRDYVYNPFNLPRVAFKIDTDEVETILTDLKWRMSKHGKFFPRIYLDKIDIDGANVTHVSGGSYNDIIKKKLGIGARVKVIRSGGIIPFITEIIEPSENYNLPENYIINGAHIWMPGFSTQHEQIIKNIINRFLPKGYGSDVYKRLKSAVESFTDHEDALEDLDEFKLFMYKVINNRSVLDSSVFRKELTTTRLRNVVYDTFDAISHYEISSKRILSLCNINGLGKTYLDAIDKEYLIDDLINDLINGAHNKLNKLCNSLNFKSIISAKDNIIKVREFFYGHGSYHPVTDEIAKPVNPDLIKVVMTQLTGSSLTKAEIKAKYSWYFNFIEKVSDADLVIYGKPGSSTYQKAESLGKKLVQVEDFITNNQSYVMRSWS